MKTTIVLLSVLLSLPILGQTFQPRPRALPPGMPQPEGQPAGERLQKNTTIRVQGTTTTGQDIDLSLTGLGPRFNADQMIAGNDSVMNCDYLVTESDQRFLISYTLVVRIKVTSNPGPPNIEYRDVSVGGTILCKPGEPVVIVKNGDKTLQITVTQEAEKSKK